MYINVYCPICNLYTVLLYADLSIIDACFYFFSLRLPSESRDINWEDEVDVSFLKDMVHIEDRESDEDGEIVLLTGASGFLGRFILWELLHNESCRTVYCICREGDG